MSPKAVFAANAGAGLQGYTPSQIAGAYNATGLSVTGAGQTIAIYALGFPSSSDPHLQLLGVDGN